MKILHQAAIPVIMGCVFQLFALSLMQNQLSQLHHAAGVAADINEALARLARMLAVSAGCTVLIALVSGFYLVRLLPMRRPRRSGQSRSAASDVNLDSDSNLDDELTDLLLADTENDWSNATKADSSLLEHLALEAERKRISADINELILPHLSNVIRLADQSRDDLLAMEVRERIDMIATGVGGIMSELHRRLLAEAGLVSSIKTLVDRFRRASMIETAMATDLLSEEIDISLESKFAIYRVTQEALNNIEKHSGATRARVTIKQISRGLTVYVEDNGRGFQEHRSTQSRGLKNIRERAAAIGAQIAWEKSISFHTGTLVTISLPLNGQSPYVVPNGEACR